jgi:WD40-like Beta Propeller Repeat
MAHLKASIGVLVLAGVLLAVTPVAHATYLGENGKISYDVYAPDDSPTIYTIDPDGSDPTPLIAGGERSAWSPDGGRIAFECSGGTCTAAANGTGIVVLDNPGLSRQQRPFWSPDSRRLIVDDVVTVGHGASTATVGDVWRIDAADGGDLIQMTRNAFSGSWSPNGRIVYGAFTSDLSDFWVGSVDATTPNTGFRLTESGKDSSPDWSPDGTKIVFVSSRDGNAEIYAMNGDGSNETRLTTNLETDSDPVWSPDGTKILFRRITNEGGVDLWLMNPDGTDQTNLTNTPTVRESAPAWQPVPQPGYVRPKGATPLRVPLVPSFAPCEAPNRTHGPPLAHPSCAPPQQRAGFMTFGSAPAGSPVQAVGHVRLDAILGAPDSIDDADVRIAVRLTDVRRGTDLADGPGGLELQLPIRLTDKDSEGPFTPQQATMQDYTLPFVFSCVETADPSVGSTCSATTTADALVPGIVDEGVRAIWQLGQISVWDGGEDGYVESRDDNTVLAVQGVFVP